LRWGVFVWPNAIKRAHHADPGEHRRAAEIGNEQDGFHRRLPFLGIVFRLRQFW
jgi:hypothetical protein